MKDESSRANALLWRLFRFGASTRLAVVLIVAMAIFLAVATVYESRYGTAPAQSIIYGSGAFLALMVLLAVNVLGAVLIRYPWTSRQLGFIITHGGIEVLLAGCLVTYYASTEGSVSIIKGQSTNSAFLTGDRIRVELPEGKSWSTPAEFWRQARYPNFTRFALGLFWPIGKPRWPEGQKLAFDVAKDVKLEVLDWLPAAKEEVNYKPVDAGAPVVQLSMRGVLENGEALSATGWVMAGEQSQPLDPRVQIALWQAHCEAEVKDFLHPPTGSGNGQVAIYLDGQSYYVGVDENVGKPVPLGTSGYSATVAEYFPASTISEGKMVKVSDEPRSPVVRVAIAKGAQVTQYVVYAQFPSMMIGAGAGHDGEAPTNLMMVFYHPATYGPAKDLRPGGIQFLQAPDASLYARVRGNDGVISAMAVKKGGEYPLWAGTRLSIQAHLPSAVAERSIVPADVSPASLDSAHHLMRVVVTAYGERSDEILLQRNEGPMEVKAGDKTVSISYGNDPWELPFELRLDDARQINDPGSTEAAKFESDVHVRWPGGKTEDHKIWMNHPMRVEGMTFCQADMGMQSKIPYSGLSIRRDRGTFVKYLGCALITLGMCFMRRYLRKVDDDQPAAVNLTDDTNHANSHTAPVGHGRGAGAH